jgi:(p)ppGpp synthase/HD superfamily hydrolase
MSTSILEKAIRLAFTAFQGKVDKAGHPAILHSFEVMLLAGVAYDDTPLPGLTTRDEFMAAGVLHDVAEDCPDYPLSYILEQFGPVIHRIVDGVTRRKTETYAEFILRAWQDTDSRALKLVDVIINMGRIHTLPPEEQSIKRRYDKAFKILNARNLEELQDLIRSPRRQTPMAGAHEQPEGSYL